MRERLRSIRPDRAIKAAGLILLGVLYVVWNIKNQPSLAGSVAAFLSAALFGVFGVRLVDAWLAEWHQARQEGLRPALCEPIAPLTLIKVFAVCLLAAAAALLLVFVFQSVGGNRQNIRDAIRIWGQLDSQHYLDIAREWYLNNDDRDRVVQLVFLPGYPLWIRLFHLVIKDWLAAGFVSAILAFSGGGVLLYCLARMDTDHAGALRTLKYLLILPGAFFFAAPMSEGLFLLLSVACLYCVRRDYWLEAGIFGGLAAFTRSLGLMLLAPAVYTLVTEMIADGREGTQKLPAYRRALSFAALLLIPAGFGAYCLVSLRVSGDAFKFLEYQREHWNQQAGLFFSTASYQTEYAITRFREGNIQTFVGLWLPNLICSFGALGVMAVAAKRLRPVYSMYFLAYYVIAIGTTWLLSAPRYLAACVSIPLGLAAETEDRRRDDVMTVVLVVLYALYAMCMANRWQVW